VSQPVVAEVKMSDKQKIFFTVATPQDQGESNVSFHDYSQIQIVNAVEWTWQWLRVGRSSYSWGRGRRVTP
jgi:hypothetical protein